MYYIRFKLKTGKTSFLMARVFTDKDQAKMMATFWNGRKPDSVFWVVDTTTEVASQTEPDEA